MEHAELAREHSSVLRRATQLAQQDLAQAAVAYKAREDAIILRTAKVLGPCLGGKGPWCRTEHNHEPCAAGAARNAGGVLRMRSLLPSSPKAPCTPVVSPQNLDELRAAHNAQMTRVKEQHAIELEQARQAGADHHQVISWMGQGTGQSSGRHAWHPCSCPTGEGKCPFALLGTCMVVFPPKLRAQSLTERGCGPGRRIALSAMQCGPSQLLCTQGLQDARRLASEEQQAKVLRGWGNRA